MAHPIGIVGQLAESRSVEIVQIIGTVASLRIWMRRLMYFMRLGVLVIVA
jgi:hypothetical protein